MARGCTCSKVANHTGTHLDAPAHVIAGGLTIVDFSPGELTYLRPTLIDVRLPEASVVEPRDLVEAVEGLDDPDLLLVRFGCAEMRRADPRAYSTRCPGFGPTAARWLRERFPSLRAIGLDVPSIACIAHLDETMRAHHELLDGDGRRFLIVEDMRLDADLDGLNEVRLWPWLVSGHGQRTLRGGRLPGLSGANRGGLLDIRCAARWRDETVQVHADAASGRAQAAHGDPTGER